MKAILDDHRADRAVRRSSLHVLLLPPLDSLRFFEAAARHQSFARAAAQPGST